MHSRARSGIRSFTLLLESDGPSGKHFIDPALDRSIDSRSDLYSLGVTFYEMLTGTLPFIASDPMELVHCHIARQPTPPHENVSSVPRAVSAIVMKLLAKTAEERYQTAAGLESDLRRCLTESETRQRIDEFPLGEHDTPDRLPGGAYFPGEGSNC